MSENTSQNRIKTNRTNAKKSTGPKTAKGKRRVRHNAVKRGLYPSACSCACKKT